MPNELTSQRPFQQKIWDDPDKLDWITKALMGLFVLLITLGGLWWSITRPMFSIHEVVLLAAPGRQLQHVSNITVKITALPLIKGNFFTLDLNEARKAFETVAWVRAAAVRREWPNKLIVTIEEHVPVGTWGDDGRLVSDKGAVFTANLAEAEAYGEMLAFSGPDGSEQEVVRRFVDMQKWFAPINLLPIGVTLSPRHSWSVKLHNGMLVELGRDESGEILKSRIDRLIAVHQQLIALTGNKVHYVDLRYPNGLAIKTTGLTLRPIEKSNKIITGPT